MSSTWGRVAQALAGAQDKARTMDQEKAALAEQEQMRKLQRDALLQGIQDKQIASQEKADARNLQQTRLSQRVASLKRQPQFAELGDDELTGMASDDGVYQKLITETLIPKKERDPIADYLEKKKIDLANPAPRQTPFEYTPEGIKAAAERARTLAQTEQPFKLEAARASVDSRTAQQTNQNASSLRGQLNSDKAFTQAQIIAPSLAKVRSSAKAGTAQGDMGMIFGLMKMLDPDTGVREGEYATAQNAAGIPDQIRNFYNKAKDGQFLSPAQRAQFVQQAESIAKAHVDALKVSSDRYSGIAQSLGIDPKLIVSDPFSAGAKPSLQERVQQLKGKVSKEEARRILQQEGYNLKGGE